PEAVPVISKVPLSITLLAPAILPGPDNANVAPLLMDADPVKRLILESVAAPPGDRQPTRTADTTAEVIGGAG
ncbi:hypothetical protein ACXX82_01170, partial [Glaciimonas sp. GNP009]